MNIWLELRGKATSSEIKQLVMSINTLDYVMECGIIPRDPLDVRPSFKVKIDPKHYADLQLEEAIGRLAVDVVEHCSAPELMLLLLEVDDELAVAYRGYAVTGTRTRTTIMLDVNTLPPVNDRDNELYDNIIDVFREGMDRGTLDISCEE